MIKLKKSTKTSLLLGHFTLFFLLMGCWGGAQSELPDAPPPYPNSPYFQGSESTNDYTPPPSPNPRGGTYSRNSESLATKTNSSYSGQSKEKTYTLEALGTIWVLIQDKFGNEIQWMSLAAGDIVPVNHNQPLTITCSRGESLKITTADGKPFQVAGKHKGITIVRLP